MPPPAMPTCLTFGQQLCQSPVTGALGVVDIPLRFCDALALALPVSGLFKHMTLKPTQKGRSEVQRCSMMDKGWGASVKMMTPTEPSASSFSVFCIRQLLLAARGSLGTGAEPLVQGVLGHFPLFQGLLDCCRGWPLAEMVCLLVQINAVYSTGVSGGRGLVCTYAASQCSFQQQQHWNDLNSVPIVKMTVENAASKWGHCCYHCLWPLLVQRNSDISCSSRLCFQGWQAALLPENWKRIYQPSYCPTCSCNPRGTLSPTGPSGAPCLIVWPSRNHELWKQLSLLPPNIFRLLSFTGTFWISALTRVVLSSDREGNFQAQKPRTDAMDRLWCVDSHVKRTAEDDGDT